MIQNSLDRMFTGMISCLGQQILPRIDDSYARGQLSACIELLANIASRVDWSATHLDAVTRCASAAVDDACAQHAELATALADLPDLGADDGSPLSARDAALARLSGAIRWLSEHASDSPAVAVCDQAAADISLLDAELLRTGMFG